MALGKTKDKIQNRIQNTKQNKKITQKSFLLFTKMFPCRDKYHKLLIFLWHIVEGYIYLVKSESKFYFWKKTC